MGKANTTEGITDPASDQASKLRVRWLTNDPGEDVWILAVDCPGYEQSSGTVNWLVGSDAKGGICNPLGRYWHDLGKRLAIAYEESPKTNCTKGSTFGVAVREIRSLCNWFGYEQRCLNVSAVSRSDIRSYEDYLAGKDLSEGTIVSKLIFVKLMWVLRREIGGGLTFNPYVASSSMQSLARKIGRPRGHTLTILPDQLFSVLDHALKTVDESGKWLDRLDYYLDYRERYSKTHAPRKYKAEFGHSSAELYQRLRLIYAAAIIIVLVLHGERKHELAATKFVDVLDAIEQKCDELIGRVHKTARSGAGRETRRPMVPELRRAFGVIVRITEESRKEYDGDKLLLRMPMSNSAPKNPQSELITSQLYRILNAFSVEVGIETALRPHMFRRSFSLIWAWRFEVGDLHMLSELLRHNSHTFTRAYTEDEDVWQFLPEAERALTFNILESLLLNEDRAFGAFGKVLERYRRRLLATVTVLSPEAIHDYVSALLDNDKLKIVAAEHGYCVMSAVRGRRSRCSTDGLNPDYVNRVHGDCVGCPNFLVTSLRTKYWEEQRDAHQKVLNSTNVEVLKMAADEGIRLSETVIGWMEQ